MKAKEACITNLLAILFHKSATLINSQLKMEIYIISILGLLVLAQAVAMVLKNFKNKYNFEISQLNSRNLGLEQEKYKLEARINTLIQEIENEKNIRFDFEKKNELLAQHLKELNIRMNEWEILKEKSIEHAKAAIFEVGGKLSSKLIEDHKREAEEANRKNHEKYKETSEILNKQFETIVNSVITLGDQVKDSKNTVDIVRQALLSPSGAGNLAEITLENILKNSGLVSGSDYKMQYSFSGGNDGNRFRPDAVIFLPGDNLMVIDSKASKFFTEIAHADSDPALKEKLVISMRNHLKQLVSKNYQDEIRDSIENKKDLNHISMIMFLPSEVALEKLRELDSEFMNKAWENNIYPSGPIGLVNILSHAKFQIMQSKQVDNYKVIIDEVNGLVGSLATLYEHARKVGVSLQSASSNFDKFAGTFNTKIVGKTRKLVNLGVVSKNKSVVPNMIDRYQVISSDKLTIVEGEVEEEQQNEDTKQLMETI